MTIQQLKCFVITADELHYTKAAERLHISQPSLSYSITELEKELNLPLFERRDHKTYLTNYGEALLPDVKEILKRVDRIAEKAEELANPESGTVRLGYFYSISFDIVPMLIEKFYCDRRHSQIALSTFSGLTSELKTKLCDESLDFIISGQLQDSKFESLYLYTQELKLIVPEGHRLCDREEVTIEDIKDEPLIAVRTSTIGTHISECFKQRGFVPDFSCSIAECSVMGAVISADMGIGISPVLPSLNSNNVRILTFKEEDRKLLGRKIYISWVRDRYLSPSAKVFLQFLKKEFQGIEQTL